MVVVAISPSDVLMRVERAQKKKGTAVQDMPSLLDSQQFAMANGLLPIT